MSGERARVLELLTEGKITVEEAEQLLDALAADEAPSGRATWPRAGLFGFSVPPVPPIPPFPPLPCFVMYPLLAGFPRPPRPPRPPRAPRPPRPPRAPRAPRARRQGGDFEDLVRMHSHGVDSEFIAEMRDIFGDEIDTREITRLYD